MGDSFAGLLPEVLPSLLERTGLELQLEVVRHLPRDGAGPVAAGS